MIAEPLLSSSALTIGSGTVIVMAMVAATSFWISSWMLTVDKCKKSITVQCAYHTFSHPASRKTMPDVAHKKHFVHQSFTQKQTAAQKLNCNELMEIGSPCSSGLVGFIDNKRQ